jgi:VCBS repeat-containing protein
VTEDTPFTATQAIGVLANDTDANNDTLTAVIVSQPSHGTVSLASNGSFVYTPSANFNGVDSFTYRAADAQSQSGVTTVTLTVAAVNDPPVALNDSYFTTGNTALTVTAPSGVLANDSDVDSPTLTAVSPTQPAHGTVTLNSNGSFSYTPNAGFSGVDSFTYRASDGSATSNLATVSITVSAAANSAPVAVNDNYTLAEDTAFTATLANGVLVNDTDADNNTLSAMVITAPAHGVLVFSSNGTFVYTPNANFNGSDSFTYQANDGLTNSNLATVSLTVTAVNDAPVAVNDSFATTSNTALTVPAAGVLANDSDVDSPTLTAIAVTQPSNGSLTLNSNGSLTYTPNAGFVGVDTFTYHANDGALNSNTATVSITVSASINSAPVAVADSYTVTEDTPFTSTLANGLLANDTDADNNTLTAVIVAQPSHGSLVLSPNGTFIYTPSANFSGTDTFTYQANDGLTNSNPATVTLTVNGVNDAPVAANDSYSATAGGALTVTAANGVLTNDSDVDSPVLTAVIVAQPSNGAVTLNSDGSFTYTPNAGFLGVDTFTYHANDGSLNSNAATVSITVTAAVNHPPVSNGDSYSLTEDTAFTAPLASGLLANDTDQDGNPLTAVLVSQPAHGTVVLSANGVFVYTPAANFNGSDSFTYQANDGSTNGNVATVSLTVDAANDAPVAVNDSYFTTSNTALNVTSPTGVLANDSDVDSPVITAAIVNQPANGSVTLNANGSFTYIPNAGFTGVDTFTYHANDGSLNSNTATVSVTVSAGTNHAPVANNDSYTLAEDGTFTATTGTGVLANDTDADSNPLTATLLTQPAHGTIVLSPNGTFIYTPNANFNGSDSFTYQASDGLTNSSPATVNFTINPVNDAPVAVNDAYSTSGGGALNISAASGVLANDSDIDSPAISASVDMTTPNGTLILNSDGSLTYTPHTGFIGVDIFTYHANDGLANSNVATVTITVSAASNTPPVANNDNYTLTEDTQLTSTLANGVLINDTDADNNSLTAVLVTQPLHGTVTMSPNGTFVYTPDANYSGPDNFTYEANDGVSNSNLATVSLTITGVNDAPVAANDTYTATAGSALTVSAANGVLANDSDVDSTTLTAVIVTSSPNGTLALNADGSFTYTPNVGFTGVDVFTYHTSDGALNSNPATVSITVVSAPNTAPVANNDAYQLTEDTPFTAQQSNGVLQNDTDVDGNILTAHIVSPPIHGTLALDPNGSFVYTPNANYNGIDSFTYQANDGSANSAVATVTLSIAAVNDVPVGVADSYSTAEDTPLNVLAPAGVLANDTDADGDTLTAVLVTNPAHGTLALYSNGSLIYTPNANFHGTDSFTYQATDSTSHSANVTVTLNVVSVNDAPVSSNDAYSVNEGAVLTVTAVSGVLNNDTDVDGDPLTAAVVTQPLHGTLTLNANGSLTYTPTAKFKGTDTFTYKANDGTADGNTATVTITVNPVDEGPVVTTSAGKRTVKARKRIVIDPAVTVTDPDTTSFSGGSMTVTIQTGAGSKDNLSYKHGGAARGAINMRRTDLRVGKTVVGTISGGLNGTALHVEFNANATLDRVKQVLQNLTFRGTHGAVGPRIIGFQVKDSNGSLSNIATKEVDET